MKLSSFVHSSGTVSLAAALAKTRSTYATSDGHLARTNSLSHLTKYGIQAK